MNNYNTHNLVTFSNSFLKHFGVTPFHQTEEAVDEALKGHKKVVVLLFDGMGRNIVRKHLVESSYIRKNYLCTINSTFLYLVYQNRNSRSTYLSLLTSY